MVNSVTELECDYGSQSTFLRSYANSDMHNEGDIPKLKSLRLKNTWTDMQRK